ncbi:MAG: hypothetical protein WA705_06090 [Candidatus Ozemobacteraceae bacterium]
MKKRFMGLLAFSMILVWFSGSAVSAVTYEQALHGSGLEVSVGNDARFGQMDTVITILAGMYQEMVINAAYGKLAKATENLCNLRGKFVIDLIKNDIQNCKKFDYLNQVMSHLEKLYVGGRNYSTCAGCFIPIFQQVNEAMEFEKNQGCSAEMKKEIDTFLPKTNKILKILMKNHEMNVKSIPIPPCYRKNK